MTTYTFTNPTDTQQFAKEFSKKLVPHTDHAVVVGLYGNLGAGKTTFTQAVAEAFGVADRVVSPTFVIEKIYALDNQPFTHLVHIDAYRIEDPKEMISLGWHDLIANNNNIICIEWPERIASIMPEHIQIKIESPDEHTRVIEVIYP